MRNSDIFDSFVKIAEEKGLISKAEKDESSHKHDFKEIKSIESLYDLKLDCPDDMKYENNISELAHKGNLVISPSYDKINGLVENINERQNILLNIVNKTPNGQLTNHKYAENQLMLSLVRIATSLDREDQDELRELGDSCIEKLALKKNSNLKKVANPLAIGFGAVAVLIGSLYAHQHLPNVDRGYRENTARLRESIQDLLNQTSSYGIGYDIDDIIRNDMNNFLNKLNEFDKGYSTCRRIIDDLQTPRTAQELRQLAAEPETTEINDAFKYLKSISSDYSTYIRQIKKNFSSTTYKESHISNKGAITSLLDNTGLHGGAGLIADDFDDVVNCIPAYLKSIDEILSILNQAQSRAADAKSKLDASISGEGAQTGVIERPSAHVHDSVDNPPTEESINDPKSLERDLDHMSSLKDLK